MYLEKDLQEVLERFPIAENVAGLEKIAASGPDKLLYSEIELELCAYINHILRNHGQRVAVVYARQRISSRAVTSILGTVKTNLLNMMLELEDELNNYDESLRTEIKPNKSLNDKIDLIMNHYTITNTGDGNVVNTGNDNKIKVNTRIVKNDIEQLRQSLRNMNVSPEDIGELERIITVEQPDLQQGQLGPQANSWIGAMFTKALSGTWQLGSQIATGTAGGLLVEIIKNYYGM